MSDYDSLLTAEGIAHKSAPAQYLAHRWDSGWVPAALTALYQDSTALSQNASYTVTFQANGGTGTMASESANVPTALTPNSFTNAGYIFTGWNTATDGSGTAYSDGATYGFSANATLYAQWTQNSSYTVTFQANGGTGTMASESANVPTALTPNSFTNAGYIFTGWNTATDGSGTAYSDGATYGFSANATLYAQWTPERLLHRHVPGQRRHRHDGK